MIKVKLTKWLGIYFFPPFTRFAFCMCKMWRCWRVLWLDAYEFSSCFWFEWETAFLQSTKLLIGTFFNRSFIQFCEAFCLSFIHTCSSTHTQRQLFHRFAILSFMANWANRQTTKRHTHKKNQENLANILDERQSNRQASLRIYTWICVVRTTWLKTFVVCQSYA